jgi:hypothetical protein
MRLDASVPASTLLRLVEQLIPLRIELGGDGEQARYLLLTGPSQAELIDHRGVRLGCRAEVCWPVLGMKLPVPLRAFRVVLLPEIRKRRDKNHTLVFRVHVEHAELAGFPRTIAARLIDLVNQALSVRDVELAWDVGATFNRSISLPRMLSTLDTLSLSLSDLQLRIENQELRISMAITPDIGRREA